MAKSKSYRKFIATSATATLVATAVAPVAGLAADFSDVENLPNEEQVAINYLVEKGVIEGKPGGIFDPFANMKRSEVAKVLVELAGLEESTKSAGFDDVKKGYWAEGYINAAVEAGLMEGKGDGKFDPEKPVKRSEFAQVVVRAYGLELQDGADHDFKDIPENYWGKEAIEIMYSNDLIKGKAEDRFAPEESIQRNHVALMVHRTDLVFGVQPAPAVNSVKVVNSNTLELSGVGLKGLDAEAISLDANEVESVTAAADGRTATVKFKHGFTPDKEQTVKVTTEDETKEFTFTYTLGEVKSVTLDAATYDDDTKGQKLSFKVNGNATEADAEWLRQAGYEVNFVSKNTDKAGPHGIFKAADPTTSKTGELADVNTVGDYVVEIQITKDGRVVVSDTKTISIIDVESTTSALKTVKFKVGEIELNSTTLVVDDKAKIFEIIGDAAGKKDVKLPVSSAKVTSSNPAVISVDGDTLTANSVGTSTITVKVGDISKTINMTVANKARAVEKVTAYESTAKVVEGQTRSIEVTAVDQYGDPIELDGSEIYVDNPDTAKVDEDEEVVTNEKGKGTYKVKGLEKGTGSILFKKKDENGAIIGKIAVQVTDVDNITSEKVEHTTVKALKTTVEKGKTTDPYQVSQFNSNGFYNGPATLGAGGYVVESANDKVATVASTGNSFTITGVKAGTTDITVKDDKGFVKHKLTITVTEEKNVITKVNFKDQVTIDYVGKVIEVADVLDVREQEGTDDAIVYGIEHNVATVNKVRITDDNKLYIDKNDDGDFDTADGDIQLGSVTAEVLTGAEGLNPFTLGTTKTVAGDKGQILFRVLEGDSTDNKDTIATTLLNVNVKK